VSAEALKYRILNTFPAGHYALEAFFRLVDVRLTDAIPTAAVECRATPALLLNPVFVEARCRTDEHLLMLVLHELHHVLLGHTRLFPRVTLAQNLAFDAVINALLSRQFPTEPYLSFFKAGYAAGAFPECLLRPPDGWPGEPRFPESLPESARRLVLTIYSESGATYAEIFEALRKALARRKKLELGSPLLGDHAPEEGVPGRGQEAADSPLLREIVRSVVEKWPQPPDPIRGRSVGAELRELFVHREHAVPAAVVTLRQAVATLAREDPRGSVAYARDGEESLPILTPLPALSDRRALVRRFLGEEPLLYRSELSRPGRIGGPALAEVFLDVSGSVTRYLPHLVAAVRPFAERRQVRVRGFSDRVAPIGAGELARGAVRTTGGTEIACVTREILENRIRRALILTDGYVGKVPEDHREGLKRSGTRLWVALTPDGYRHDLEGVAERVFELPGI
jgi:hypothetical protein